MPIACQSNTSLRPRLRGFVRRVVLRIGPLDVGFALVFGRRFVGWLLAHPAISLARLITSSIGNDLPQSQCPPPHDPSCTCWQTPRPEPCACASLSFVIGRSNAAASSAIHRAQFSSMFGCCAHVAADHDANAHNSACTATGLAFAAVQALLPRLTYSPTTPSPSSMPTCDDTPDDDDAK